MIFYFFFLILAFLPLIEGEFLGIGRFLLLSSCLPLTFFLAKKKIVKDNIFISFVGFLILALLSTILSSVFSRSLNSLVLYFVYFVFFLTSRILADEKKQFFKDFLIISIIFPSLVLCLLSFYLLFIKETPPFSTMNLIFANFGHNHLIDYLIFAFPISLFLLFKETEKFKRFLFLILSSIFLAGFIFSFSRGGMLMAILIILSVNFLLRFNKQVKTYNLLNFLMILLVIAVLISGTSGFYIFGEDKIQSSNNLLIKKIFRQLPVESRLEYWRQAILSFKERPFGWGLDNFRYLSRKYQSNSFDWSWYVHNHFLQTFVETGCLGGAVFLLLIFFVIKNIFKNLKKEFSLNSILTIGVFTSIFHSFFDYDWQFPSVFLLFWVITGYLTQTQSQINKKHIVDKTLFLFLGTIIFAISILEFTANSFLFFGTSIGEKTYHQKAEHFYQKTLAVWPFKLENWQIIINFYKNKDRDKAIELTKKLVLLEPIYDENFVLLGDLFYENNNFKEAKDNYLKAIKFNPQESIGLYIKIASNWPKWKDSPRELFSILQTIENIKGKTCSLKCLGFENEEKILDFLLQLIKQDEFYQLGEKQQAKVYFWLAVLTSHERDWDKNIHWLQKAINVDQKEEYKDFLDDLVTVEKIKDKFLKKDYAEIEKLSEELVLKRKDYAFYQKFYLSEVYYFLSRFYLFEQDLKLALETAEKGLKINPWLDLLYIVRADIYESENEKDGEKRIIEKCLAINEWSFFCRERLNKITSDDKN